MKDQSENNNLRETNKLKRHEHAVHTVCGYAVIIGVIIIIILVLYGVTQF